MTVEIVQRTVAGVDISVVSIGGSGRNELVLPANRLQPIDYVYLNQVDQWEIEDSPDASFRDKYEAAILSILVPARQIFDTRATTIGELEDAYTEKPEVDIWELSGKVDVLGNKISNSINPRIEDLEQSTADLGEDVGTVSDKVDNISDSVGTISDSVNAVSDKVLDVENKISEDLEPRVETLEQAVEDFNSDLYVEEPAQ